MASKKGWALLEVGFPFRKAGSVAKPSPLHGLPGISIATSWTLIFVGGEGSSQGLKKGLRQLELMTHSSRARLWHYPHPHTL